MVKKPDGRQARSVRTRTALLDATEQVIRDEGVSAITLERVAAVAGVSKGGLLYHFASKQELISALLQHTLDGTNAELVGLAEEGQGAGAFARAYLDYVRTSEHTQHGAAMGIFASAALDEGELAPAQGQFEQWQERLLNGDGIDPTLALLARVVGDGLWLIDLFGLAPPTVEQRGELLDLVQALVAESTV